MKSKSLILLVLSIGFGIVAAIGISQVMNNQTIAEPTTPRGPVLLATGPIDMRALLTEENVKIENWPTDIIPPDAVTSLDEVTDMVTLNRLGEGMPIVKSGIQHKNKSMSQPIPPGMKVVAVRVSADDTIGNLLNPGDRVDVIGIFKQRDRNTNHTTTNSRTFLKALQVYSIGNKTTRDNKEKSGSSSGTSIVGLLVNQKQSEALVFVQDTGSIKLVLRGDDKENTGEVGELDEIRSELEMLAEQERAKPKKDMDKVKIWMGPKSVETEFDEHGNPRPASESDSKSGEMSNPDGRGDSDSRGDSDRGIGDDQYRGE